MEGLVPIVAEATAAKAALIGTNSSYKVEKFSLVSSVAFGILDSFCRGNDGGRSQQQISFQ